MLVSFNAQALALQKERISDTPTHFNDANSSNNWFFFFATIAEQISKSTKHRRSFRSEASQFS